MELLKAQINPELKKNIKELSCELFKHKENNGDENVISSYFSKENIGYYNIYHIKFEHEKNKKYSDLISNILKEINIELDDILYIGFIYSYPKCFNQKFHYDYSNNTETFFIPLIDITDLNGTEFLHFYDLTNYDNYFDILNKINNTYSSKDDVINYLEKHKIQPTHYEFKVYNSDTYSLYKLPPNVFHRGKTNETNDVRIMMQIVKINNKNYIKNILCNEMIINAELDDNNSLKNIFYFLKYKKKYLSLSKRGKNYNYSCIEYSEHYELKNINNYKWYTKIINNLLYIYHSSGLILTITENVLEPFHFSITFNEKYNWNLIGKNNMIFNKNIENIVKESISIEIQPTY